MNLVCSLIVIVQMLDIWIGITNSNCKRRLRALTHNQIAAEGNRLEKERNRITEEYNTERNRIDEAANDETRRHNQASEELERASQSLKEREILLTNAFKYDQLALDTELGRSKISIESFLANETKDNNLRNYEINQEKNSITREYNESMIEIENTRRDIEKQKVANDFQLNLGKLAIEAATAQNNARIGEINALTNRLNALNQKKATEANIRYQVAEAETHRITAESNASQALTAQLNLEFQRMKYDETKWLEGLGNVGSFFGGIGRFVSSAALWLK